MDRDTVRVSRLAIGGASLLQGVENSHRDAPAVGECFPAVQFVHEEAPEVQVSRDYPCQQEEEHRRGTESEGSA